MEDLTSSTPTSDVGGQSFETLNAMDFTNVSTDYPVLKSGVYRFSVKDLKIEDSKKTPGNKLFVLTLALESAAACEDGKPANKGLVHIERISLAEKENYDPKVNLAKIQMCFFGYKGKVDWNSLRGMQGDVRLKVVEDKEYGRQNRVQNWVPKSTNTVAPSL